MELKHTRLRTRTPSLCFWSPSTHWVCLLSPPERVEGDQMTSRYLTGLIIYGSHNTTILIDSAIYLLQSICTISLSVCTKTLWGRQDRYCFLCFKTKKRSQLIKGVIAGKIPLRVTGTESHWDTLEAVYDTHLPYPPRGEGAGILIDQLLSMIRRRDLNFWHFWLDVHVAKWAQETREVQRNMWVLAVESRPVHWSGWFEGGWLVITSICYSVLWEDALVTFTCK